MSWSPLTLSTPASSALSVNHNIGIFSITPWTHGIAEGQGVNTWLSFPNAVEAVINRVNGLAASSVLAVAVSAPNLNAFAAQIAALSVEFPVRDLAQWKRQAEHLSTLVDDKFILRDPEVFTTARAVHALPAITRQMEKAMTQQALADAGSLAASDPLVNLTAFEADKAAHDTEVNTALQALSVSAGWRFYADADITNALRTAHPGHEYTLTAILVFYGSAGDLAYLNEMLT